MVQNSYLYYKTPVFLRKIIYYFIAFVNKAVKDRYKICTHILENP